jgi:NADH-quinone oxidoreductase subunit E
MTNEQRRRANEILEKHEFRHENLIAILQEIQKEELFLPREVLELVSRQMEVPLSRIFSMATFYKSFSLAPRGRHRMKVCTGTACHIKGAKQNREEIVRKLGISEGETTPDLSFSLETVNCLGACALAPVIMVDEDYYDGITPAKIRKILKHYTANDEKRRDDSN